MRLITYLQSNGIIETKRLGIEHNDKIIDPQLVWNFYFKKNGFYNTEIRSQRKISHSLFENLRTQENTLLLLKETLDLASNFIKDGDQDNFSFKKSPNLKTTSPLDHNASYRDWETDRKSVV